VYYESAMRASSRVTTSMMIMPRSICARLTLTERVAGLGCLDGSSSAVSRTSSPRRCRWMPLFAVDWIGLDWIRSTWRWEKREGFHRETLLDTGVWPVGRDGRGTVWCHGHRWRSGGPSSSSCPSAPNRERATEALRRERPLERRLRRWIRARSHEVPPIGEMEA
jgi:hypothetical protein